MSQEIELARSLKGAPAAIFLALVLHGGLQTTKNLCHYTGYSDKVVRQGLAHLKETGLAYDDADLRAWYLLPGTQLLKLLQGALATAEDAYSYRGPAPAAAPDSPLWRQATEKLSTGLSTELSTEQVIGEETEDSSPTAEDFTAGAEVFTAAVDGRSRAVLENSAREAEDLRVHAPEPAVIAKDSVLSAAQATIPPAALPEEITVDAEEITVDAEDFTAQAEESSPSRAPITAAAINPDKLDQDAASKQAPAKNARAPSSPNDSRQRVLKEWLVRGGIAPNSPKMRDLLARNLNLQAVQAHVLERQACEAGLVNGRPTFGAGLLIRKLLDGDPPPPLRCRNCLRLPDRLGMCGCDYETLIKR